MLRTDVTQPPFFFKYTSFRLKVRAKKSDEAEICEVCTKRENKTSHHAVPTLPKREKKRKLWKTNLYSCLSFFTN